MLTELQKKTSQAIVNVFETGRLRGDYGSVVVARNDAGHLTYGRSQTTLASGNLFLLIEDYCQAPGAARAAALAPYLTRLKARDLALDGDAALRAALRAAGGDPVMRRVQDSFFDRVYWQPALARSSSLGLTTALGATVVYDGTIHGSFARLRDRTSARHGTPADIGEPAWLARYIAERRAWLAGFDPATSLLPKAVYRMDELKKLHDAQHWGLPLPLRIRNVAVDEAALSSDDTPVTASASDDRLQFLAEPRLEGDDVRALQAALRKAGHELEVDGDFGAGTDRALRAFQAAAGLKADGILGPATRGRLGL
jgi:chitosanase